MVADIRDPTEDSRKGSGGAVPGRNWRDRTTGAVRYAVSEEAVTLVGDRKGLTAGEEVREGVMVTTPTPPPSQYGQIMWGGGQNFRD